MKNIENWVTKKSTVIISVFGLVIALILQSMYKQFLISDHYYQLIAEPLGHISLSLVIVSFVLFFVREEIFRSWSYFARWWISFHIVIFFLLFLTGKDNGGGFFNVSFTEPISMFFSGAFLAISLILIITKYTTLQKKA